MNYNGSSVVRAQYYATYKTKAQRINSPLTQLMNNLHMILLRKQLNLVLPLWGEKKKKAQYMEDSHGAVNPSKRN